MKFVFTVSCHTVLHSKYLYTQIRKIQVSGELGKVWNIVKNCISRVTLPKLNPKF